jgi:peptide/nickel transport system substrate-binding protein
MFRRYILFLTAIALIFSGCKPKQTYILKKDYKDIPAYGDMLVDSSIGEPANLDPVLASDSPSFDIIGNVFNGLVRYNKDLRLEGDLAKSWEITDGGKVITFNLRHGVKWHDGAEFTSEDVKFTYDSFMDPKVKTAYRSQFELVSSVETPDKYTFRVHYKTTYAPALESWGVPIIPSHLLKGKDLNTSSFSRNPVGTGPYVFKKWVTNQKIELVSFKDYYEGMPYIAQYLYRIIPDESVQFMNLIAGNLDMMSLSPDQFTRKSTDVNFTENFSKYSFPNFQYRYIGYNMENPLFKSKKVRQALSYAINTAEIIQGVAQGLAQPLSGPFIPGSWAYNDMIKPYPYDPEKAAHLLKEDGWAKGKDGILEKDGKKFVFVIYTNQGNKEREEIATIAQQEWSKLGISTTIRVLAWNIFITQFIDKRKFDAVVMGWSLTKDPDCYDIWHSSKTKEGEFNFVSFKNSEVDRLLEKARTTFDIKERASAYKRIHAIIADEAPYTFLYSPYSLSAVHKRIKGIKPAPAGIGYNFIRWYVPAELQKYTIQLAN